MFLETSRAQALDTGQRGNSEVANKHAVRSTCWRRGGAWPETRSLLRDSGQSPPLLGLFLHLHRGLVMVPALAGPCENKTGHRHVLLALARHEEVSG